MLKFQRWNALRRGDAVFVVMMPVRTEPSACAPASSPTSTSHRSGHDVAVASLPGMSTGPVVRPGRFAVHLTAGQDDNCCVAANRPQPASLLWPPLLARSVEFGDGVAVLSAPASMTAEQYPPDQRAPGRLPNRSAARPPLPRLLRARRPPDGVRRGEQPERARRLHRDADADPRHRTHRHGHGRSRSRSTTSSTAVTRRHCEPRSPSFANKAFFFIRPLDKLREKLHGVTAKPSENHDPDETSTSAR